MIEDCSRDSSKDIINEYVSKYNYYNTIYLEKILESIPRNIAIKKARVNI